MSSISLSIQNPGTTPADAPYLYLGQANTLNLVFTSNMGVSTLNPGDKFTLILPANLLAAPSAENLNSPDWQLISAQSNGSSYLVELSPQASLSFKTPLTISFQNLQASVIGMGDVSTRYLIGGRPVSGSSAKLSVINPPSQPKNLPDAIRFGVLFNDEQDIISNEQLALSPAALQPPIANRIHVNFTFNGDYLVENWGPTAPQFTISFSYGEDAHALTNALQASSPGYNALTSAWNIGCALESDENSQWTVQSPNAGASSPNWVIRPSLNNPSLFTQQQPELDVYFSHVISNLPEGSATLYVQWNNIPGYNDGVTALWIPKSLPKPMVIAFGSPQDGQTIKPDTPVTLNWQAFAADTLTITWDEGVQQRQLSAFNPAQPQFFYAGSLDNIVPDSPNTSYFLYLNNKKDQVGPIEVRVSDFPAPTIAQFSGALQLDANGDLEIELQWLVENLGNDANFYLNGERLDAAGYNGILYTKTIPAVGLSFPQYFTLRAVDNVNQTSSTQKNTVEIPNWLIPQINTFAGTIQRNAAGGAISVDFSFQIDHLIKRSICDFNGQAYTPDQQGNGRLSFPINAENPLKSTYTLSVTNPACAPVSKTLKVQFEQAERIQSPANSRLVALTIHQESQTLFALFAGESDDIILGTCPLNQPPNWQFSEHFSLAGKPPLKLFSNLVVSPDGTQVFINGETLYAISYTGNTFGTSLYRISKAENSNVFDNLCTVFKPDMSMVFISGYYQLDYFKPDVSTYQALGQNNWAPVPAKNIAYNYLDVEALAITPDGKRVFVADHANSKIWYFDTDNIPATFAQGIAQAGIKALAMTKNGWLYAANSDTVYALDTAAENYTFASSFALSEFNLIFNLTASVDNSFVLFSRINNLHILTGVRTGYSTLALLQSINISDLLNVAIVPDNTQIYVARLMAFEVLRAAENLV